MGLCLGYLDPTGHGDHPRAVIVRDDTQIVIDTGGVPPDKEAEIKLLLQKRDSSARRCYQDVLNEKHTGSSRGRSRSSSLSTPLDTAGRAWRGER